MSRSPKKSRRVQRSVGPAENDVYADPNRRPTMSRFRQPDKTSIDTNGRRIDCMTIVYVTTGAWGAGTGTPNSAAQVDGNFYDVDQRIVDLNADLAEGKRIDTVTYTSNSMTFHFTDGTTQVIPLPVAIARLCRRLDELHAVSCAATCLARGIGIYQVLEDHTTPALPAPFDPNATDGSRQSALSALDAAARCQL